MWMTNIVEFDIPVKIVGESASKMEIGICNSLSRGGKEIGIYIQVLELLGQG